MFEGYATKSTDRIAEDYYDNVNQNRYELLFLSYVKNMLFAVGDDRLALAPLRDKIFR